MRISLPVYSASLLLLQNAPPAVTAATAFMKMATVGLAGSLYAGGPCYTPWTGLCARGHVDVTRSVGSTWQA